MDSLDEMEHPLLGSSPKRGCHSGAPINTGGHLRGAPGRVLPSLAWRGYCSQPELLDPGSLPATLEPYYSSGPLWGYNDPRGLHKEYLETTFMDVGHCPQLERKLFTEAKDAHSVSYSMEDEDDLLPDYEDSSSEDFSDMDSDSDFPLMIPQDYLGLAFFSMLCCFWPLGIGAFYLSQKTNKESAKGNFQAASAASRQALWLSVLSIVFGIITYMCAIAALISYLSGKPS